MVLGRGLGLQAVLLEVLRQSLTRGGFDGRHATRLILLLGTPQEEVELLLQRANEDPRWSGLLSHLTSVGSDLSVEERALALAAGGIFAVSARVLVPDLLAGRVLPETLDGIVVNHAHTVGELSAEAFALRLYRQKSEKGFVYGLSDKPEAFLRGQASIEKVMQRCFANELEVWPRIRAEVRDCLSVAEPDVSQRTLPLPAKASEIQFHILNIVQGTLDELRKDPHLEMGNFKVRDTLSQAFEAELKQVLDPAWNSLGPRSRQLAQDLSVLRRLLLEVLRCNAVEFHGFLESVCYAESDRDVPSWLLGADAQALLALARARVYQLEAPQENSGQRGPTLKRTLEPHAKWQELVEIVNRTVSEVAAWVEARDARKEDSGDKVLLPAPGHLELETPLIEALDDDAEEDSDLEIVSVQHAKKKPRLAPTLKTNSSAPASATAGGSSLSGARGSSTCPAPSDARSDVIEPRLVVIVPDERVKRQLWGVLHRGAQATLLDALASYARARSRSNSTVSKAGKHGSTANPGADQGSGPYHKPRVASTVGVAEATLLAKEADLALRELESIFPDSLLQLRLLPSGRPCHPRVDIIAADGPDGMLERRLKEASPHAVVLFEPSLQAIRALEVHCALVATSSFSRAMKREPGQAPVQELVDLVEIDERDWALRVHILVFEDSAEKYCFSQSLLHESEAIDGLIRARQHLTWRVDTSLAAAPLSTIGAGEPGGLRSTRSGGGSRTLDALVQQKVVVDMREFRSAVPFMLHMRGLTIDPVTIPVGDYVLSRDICVERKAIPDLVQSFSSGRLYQQVQNMMQHYESPSLLIEFDPGKSFQLQNTYVIARREVDVRAKDLLGKLSLLVLQFPKLKLLWSPSQRFTADIFLKLKAGRYQPDPRAAAQIDAEDLHDALEDLPSGPVNAKRGPRSNTAAFDLLRKLPGVTPRNMHALARKAGSLAGVLDVAQEDLVEILGRTGAEQLTDFLSKEAAMHSLLGQAVGAAAASEASGQE